MKLGSEAPEGRLMRTRSVHQPRSASKRSALVIQYNDREAQF